MGQTTATKRSGYSLIEMMIVITMIAIITAFAMPRVDYQSYRQDGSVRAVRGALQQAEAYAVSSQHNVFVDVDQAHNVLYVVYDYNDNLTWDPTEHKIAVPLLEGVKIANAPIALPGRAVPTTGLGMTTPTTVTITGITANRGFVFRADGAVSSDVQIYLGSKRGLAKDARAIDVLQSTAHVDWYKYVNSTWVSGGF